MHIASVLGQLDGIELPGVKDYILSAKSVQELVDMPFPAEDLAKVCSWAGVLVHRTSLLSDL